MGEFDITYKEMSLILYQSSNKSLICPTILIWFHFEMVPSVLMVVVGQSCWVTCCPGASTVGRGPTVLAVDAKWDCLDFFALSYYIPFLSPSVLETSFNLKINLIQQPTTHSQASNLFCLFNLFIYQLGEEIKRQYDFVLFL